ncbi:MAG: cupin domain-containing protein [Gammaproteobacteria bacterium]|nr:cupin domain-containing protein [Gammaproteobacteria bacterium]
MRIAADFARRAVGLPAQAQWHASPETGVIRRMLDRVGGEIARATSVVRYAPGSRFAAHTHGGGEELLVLDGVFGDEHGLYPAGSYLRNPIGTAHAPYSEPGCTLLVKLWQFDPADRQPLMLDTTVAGWSAGPAAGIETLPLHRFGAERVALQRWRPGSRLSKMHYPGGAEFYVLDGSFEDEEGSYTQDAWLRLPPGAVHRPRSPAGCRLYLKTGHLPPRRLPAPGA